MKEYRAHFQRYRNKQADMTVSSFVTIYAEDFGDAYRRAVDMLTGMRQADPDSLYDVQSMEAVGVRAEPVKMGGPSIFEPYVEKESA